MMVVTRCLGRTRQRHGKAPVDLKLDAAVWIADEHGENRYDLGFWAEVHAVDWRHEEQGGAGW